MFYGWYIVATGAIILSYYSAVILYGFTAFIDPMVTTFGWSYAQISLGVSLRGIEQGVLGPLMGIMVDRWSPKLLAVIGILVLGLGLLCISRVTGLVMFYACFALIAFGTSLAIYMVPISTTARWFRKDIGKASGILSMGNGIGGLLVPLIVMMIDAYGWRSTLMYLAVGMWVLGIPMSFVYRNPVKENNVLSNRNNSGDSENINSAVPHESSVGIKEAVRMRAFWQIGIVWMIHMGAISAISVHIMPYLTSLGMERASASIVVMIVSIASLAVRLPFGLLTDVFKKKYVMSLAISLMGIGMFLFWIIDGSSMKLIYAFAVFAGCGIGGLFPLQTPIIREYFGKKNFGTIFGLTSGFVTAGMVSTPPIAGWVYDSFGVYDPVWLVLCGATLVGLILTLTIPPPSLKLA